MPDMDSVHDGGHACSLPDLSSSKDSVEPAATATISLHKSRWSSSHALTGNSGDKAHGVCLDTQDNDASAAPRQCSSAGALGAASPHQHNTPDGCAMISRNALSGENTVPHTPRASGNDLGEQLTAACSLLDSLALTYRNREDSSSDPYSSGPSKLSSPGDPARLQERMLPLPPSLVPCADGRLEDQQKPHHMDKTPHDSACLQPGPIPSSTEQAQASKLHGPDSVPAAQQGAQPAPRPSAPSAAGSGLSASALKSSAVTFTPRVSQLAPTAPLVGPSAGLPLSQHPSHPPSTPKEVPTLYIPPYVPPTPSDEDDDAEEEEEEDWEEEGEEEEEDYSYYERQDSYAGQAGEQLQQCGSSMAEGGGSEAPSSSAPQEPQAVKALLPVQGMVNVNGQMVMMGQLLPMQLVNMNGQMIWVPCSIVDPQTGACTATATATATASQVSTPKPPASTSSMSSQMTFTQPAFPQVASQQPQMMYQQPQVAFQQPQVAFQQPQVAFQQPQVAFQQPQVAFQQPQIAFQQPQIAFQQPQVVFQQPQMVYQQPQVVYQQPAMVYQQPQMVYQQAAMHPHQCYQQVMPLTAPIPHQHASTTTAVYTVRHPGHAEGGLAAAKPAWGNE